MNTQPEALRLAESLEADFKSDSHNFDDMIQAAAELRRLHQSEREGWRHADELEQERQRLKAVNADLLKACKQALYALKGREHDQFLRAAIAKAEAA